MSIFKFNPTEVRAWAILWFNRDKLVTFESIYKFMCNQTYIPDKDHTMSYVRVVIGRLRNLGLDIVSVRGTGYFLDTSTEDDINFTYTKMLQSYAKSVTL